MVRRDDRLVKHILRHGDGRTRPEKGRAVLLHYTAAHRNGQIFDSTHLEPQGPRHFVVGLGQLIKGIDLAVQSMSEGEHALIRVPAIYAYGAQGLPGLVPPDTDLIYEVSLVRVLR
ncbi:FKBP-type peptidyl-prolyl cis-trans isomerase [Giardia muris]|uniref:peptidylprolyl isomerase n=1 Tax=Giardia muris TaxID=5742 RepID=A0A4Z1STA1_GIAMU|nr:FKBP-type peptidyl-prolyl cis-trans isomerase [Giardia muris]|eukprot:TNJ26878.1 FKBP-type peptidyl-prolyl cis-trans isomerase [Giardia muris]